MSAATTASARREELVEHYETARPDVQALVPREARRILDLGCASGALGAGLKRRDPAVEVVGIEYDRGYAADAEARLDRVLHGDLDELLAREGLAAELGSFDCIVAADVLEHLRDPWSVLARAAQLLEPGGRAVLSVPNVRHWTTFFELAVRGRWPRREFGIFDRTHLRWFTLADARDLVEQAGLRPLEVRRSYWFPRGGWFDRNQRLLDLLPMRGFLAHQHLLAAVKP